MTVISYFENNSISLSEIGIKSDKIASEFAGYKIIHLSDLHDKSFGRDQKYLVKIIKENHPDLIVFMVIQLMQEDIMKR